MVEVPYFPYFPQRYISRLEHDCHNSPAILTPHHWWEFLSRAFRWYCHVCNVHISTWHHANMHVHHRVVSENVCRNHWYPLVKFVLATLGNDLLEALATRRFRHLLQYGVWCRSVRQDQHRLPVWPMLRLVVSVFRTAPQELDRGNSLVLGSPEAVPTRFAEMRCWCQPCFQQMAE